MKKGNKQSVNIDDDEWCFEDCPDEFLQECLDYELAREVHEIRKAYAKAKEAGAYATPGVIQLSFPERYENGTLAEAKMIRLPDGFPDVPFLQTEYYRLHAPPVTASPKAAKAQEKLPWRDKQEAANGAKLDTLKAKERETAKQSSLGALEGISPYFDGEPIDRQACRVLKVDFRFSRRRLKDAFIAWLQINWQKQPTALTKRGTPLERVNRGRLKALGAYRLMDKFHGGLTVEAAMQHAHNKNADLFSEFPGWYAAKKRAERAIDSVRKAFTAGCHNPILVKSLTADVANGMIALGVQEPTENPISDPWEKKKKQLLSEGYWEKKKPRRKQ